jgi:hypothetical protein
MPETGAEIRAAVKHRFAQVARSPEQEKKFPVGPASAKKLGYDRWQLWQVVRDEAGYPSSQKTVLHWRHWPRR